MSVCVGMVIGAGIFKSTPSVAANLGSEFSLYLAWGIGGLLSLVGALCFAEMAAAFPDAGGDYYFLRRAYGERLGFLFAWSRFSVIHTGSMALLGFVFGDYLAQLVPLGPYGSALFAACVIILLTGLNLRGVKVGVGTQVGLTLLVLFGLFCVGLAGVWLAWCGLPAAAPAAPLAHEAGNPGVAMVFIFLAYGGWNDAATLSAEMRDARHGIVWALLFGLLIVTALYLLTNWAFIRGLGLSGLARSSAPAAELMRHVFGRWGEILIVGVVAITSISVMNALLIAGARTTYAAARDMPGLEALGDWDGERGVPPYAVLAMGIVALVLVLFGSLTRGGFETMVDYLSPVFWFFFLLSGGAVVVLRYRHPQVARPFRVPFFPLPPALFCVTSAYLLYSSLVYTKIGALLGIGVLALGGGLIAWQLGRATPKVVGDAV